MKSILLTVLSFTTIFTTAVSQANPANCQKQLSAIEEAVSVISSFDRSGQTKDLIYYWSDKAKEYALEETVDAAGFAVEARKQGMCTRGDRSEIVVWLHMNVFCHGMARNLITDVVQFGSKQLQDRYLQAVITLAEFTKNDSIGCSENLAHANLSKDRVKK